MLLHPEVVNMARRKYTGRSEEAVSTVVSAILLLALVVALITSINVRYVPQWTEDAEHLHMRTVTNDMAHLKSGVDLMLTASATGSNSFSAGIPITMGGGEVPFFSSLSSSSTLLLNSRTPTTTTRRRRSMLCSYVKRQPRASLRVLLERVARLRAGLGRRRRRGAVSGL